MVAGYFIMLESTINIDLSGLENFQSDIDSQLNSSNGPVNDALKLWAIRYRSYIQLRFDTFSRGGGNWRDLSPATKKARRGNKKAKSRTFAILRDTGTLFAALNPVFSGAPGALQEAIPFGIRVGYGGPQTYQKGAGKGATIADVASFHQNGAEPRLPKREIIVAPDDSLLELMSKDMTRALNALAE